MEKQILSNAVFRGKSRHAYLRLNNNRAFLQLRGKGRMASVTIELNNQSLDELFDALVEAKAYIHPSNGV